MASISSSSSRTILDRNPDKQVLIEDDVESSNNLDGLEIPNLNLCNSFDFINEDILQDVGDVTRRSPPLSPQTLGKKSFGKVLNWGNMNFQKGAIFIMLVIT